MQMSTNLSSTSIPKLIMLRGIMYLKKEKILFLENVAEIDICILLTFQVTY